MRRLTSISFERTSPPWRRSSPAFRRREDFERKSLTVRLERLRQELSRQEFREGGQAEVALTFTGAPVLGTSGIDAKFGGKTVGAMQDLISKVAATRRFGPLAARGAVPSEDSFRLQVVGVARGSFGFVLAERDPGLFSTPVNEAIGETMWLMAAAIEDPDLVAAALAESDERVHKALTTFLDIVRKGDASFRLASGGRYVEATVPTVARAVENSRHVHRTESKTIELRGTLAGVMTIAGRFEFETDDGKVLRGKIAKDADSEALAGDMLKRGEATLQAVTSRADGGTEHLGYTLISFDPR